MNRFESIGSRILTLGYEFHSICNSGSNEICAVLYNKLTES